MIEAVMIYIGITLGWWAIDSSLDARALEVDHCISDQLEAYGDLCAESSSGYEDMAGTDAHFEGVRCAVESAQACIGAQ